MTICHMTSRHDIFKLLQEIFFTNHCTKNIKFNMTRIYEGTIFAIFICRNNQKFTIMTTNKIIVPQEKILAMSNVWQYCYNLYINGCKNTNLNIVLLDNLNLQFYLNNDQLTLIYDINEGFIYINENGQRKNNQSLINYIYNNEIY